MIVGFSWTPFQCVDVKKINESVCVFICFSHKWWIVKQFYTIYNRNQCYHNEAHQSLCLLLWITDKNYLWMKNYSGFNKIMTKGKTVIDVSLSTNIKGGEIKHNKKKQKAYSHSPKCHFPNRCQQVCSIWMKTES